ncbi:bifunctional heptose 7-phosphate kinase/heptose 1-phosphate adenyltransferase [Calidifontibacter sp. DB0510]|uniref:Bifunctional heptose 7-phosphate kinase/heptose 1-phosphate adenyltransferase n=1 Tax=Metallococcus carri TaxID=1656884 RepID=A0A967AX86_9MICO|nr:PfkB family carbohydrate kinase [Metallococcus carri]NHN54659.1 bifunctional heptose 7-phosphate kinase/heptose 1-phosphate adenyltransferase [Metallococcus carri]NOP37004.1 bifunctional heptose 7-phosphate kinase/heptose 1-phosphate adenyltransferase [Calidifontibacter sp. DB2511S]
MTRRARIVVVGDLVLDRDVDGRVERECPDAPAPVLDVERSVQGPGGAGLAALLAVAPDTDVHLIAPLAADARGEQLRAALSDAGVGLTALPHLGGTRTKTRLRAGDRVITRYDEGGPGTPPPGAPPDAVGALLREANAILVSDYGAGTTSHAGLRELLARTARDGRAPIVWDPHPRGTTPLPGCAVVTPNLGEAQHFSPIERPTTHLPEALRAQWSAEAVCVTRGADGALLARAGHPLTRVPVPDVRDRDTCGAGDSFAASLTRSLATGHTLYAAVHRAAADAAEWVRGNGTTGFRQRSGRVGPMGDSAGVLDSAGLPRTPGERVVATGGCFDLLHAGHIGSLRAARSLGDRLVELLNSDRSVRRLKGPTRPVQTQDDRAAVLRALDVVDEVVIFDEDDPCRLLATLRPDIWAKGGDYDPETLPEADLVRSWGGEVVILPFVAGMSTTGLVQTIVGRAALETAADA